MIQDEIITSRRQGIEKKLVSLEEEPFIIEDVKVHSLSSETVSKLLAEILPYETDGLIFTPVDGVRPYNVSIVFMNNCITKYFFVYVL